MSMIMGIDASTKCSGISIFKDNELIYYTDIKASSKDVIERIYKMRDNINDILTQYPIEKIILEEIIPSGPAQTWKALSKLQAAILFLLHDNFPHIDVIYIQPNSWRSQLGIKTGKGITREQLKAADIEFVKEKFNIDVNDDIADSICIAYSQIADNPFFDFFS